MVTQNHRKHFPETGPPYRPHPPLWSTLQAPPTLMVHLTGPTHPYGPPYRPHPPLWSTLQAPLTLMVHLTGPTHPYGPPYRPHSPLCFSTLPIALQCFTHNNNSTTNHSLTHKYTPIYTDSTRLYHSHQDIIPRVGTNYCSHNGHSGGANSTGISTMHKGPHCPRLFTHSGSRYIIHGTKLAGRVAIYVR